MVGESLEREQVCIRFLKSTTTISPSKPGGFDRDSLVYVQDKKSFFSKPDLSLISKTDKCFILEQNRGKKFLRSAAALLLLRRRTTTFWSAKKEKKRPKKNSYKIEAKKVNSITYSVELGLLGQKIWSQEMQRFSFLGDLIYDCQ